MSLTRSVTVQARDGEEVCPYCRERLAPGERVLVCEGCQAPYHEECMRHELGRCATIGCAGRRALPRAYGGDASATPAPPRTSPRSPPPDRNLCAGCHGALRLNEQVLVCVGCRAEYHPACAGTLTGCAHRGCASVEARRRTRGEEEGPPGWVLALVLAVGAGALTLILALFVAKGPVTLGLAATTALSALLCVVFAAYARYARALDQPLRFGAPAPARPDPSGPLPCATCSRPLARGEPLLECEGCGRQHHAGCLREAGRCRVEGCTGTRAVPRRAL